MLFQPIWQRAYFSQGVQLTCAVSCESITGFVTQNSGLLSSLGHLGANRPSRAKPVERRAALRREYRPLCANVFSRHSMGAVWGPTAVCGHYAAVPGYFQLAIPTRTLVIKNAFFTLQIRWLICFCGFTVRFYSMYIQSKNRQALPNI